MKQDALIYRIDRADTIVAVSSNWRSFAADNLWHGVRQADDVIGRPLWDFIQGSDTRLLYQELFRRIRAGRPCQPLSFRCDAPSERRWLELVLDRLPEDGIGFTSQTVRTERRSSLWLLEEGRRRSKNFVTICSLCKRIRVSLEEWADLEEGLLRLRLFESDEMPFVNHGVCPACHRIALQGPEAG